MYNLKEEMRDKSKQNTRNRSRESEKTRSQINAEYFQALEQWMNDVRSYTYSCNFFAGFPYSMMAQQMSSVPPTVGSNFTPMPGLNQGFGIFMYPNQQQQTALADNVVEYVIPPLWKRGVAELLDFLLLFFVKIALTYIAIDFFGLIDFKNYGPIQDPNKLDLKVFLQFTSDITFLELAYKLIVCFYEGSLLSKGLQNQVGGATFGKAFMGIRVILCNSIEQVENQPNLVKVICAKDLGFGWSLARAFLKNVILNFLLPVQFPYFMNRFNRTVYDVLCHTLVVEDTPPRTMRNR